MQLAMVDAMPKLLWDQIGIKSEVNSCFIQLIVHGKSMVT